MVFFLLRYLSDVLELGGGQTGHCRSAIQVAAPLFIRFSLGSNRYFTVNCNKNISVL